jgi:hypothetical protein
VGSSTHWGDPCSERRALDLVGRARQYAFVARGSLSRAFLFPIVEIWHLPHGSRSPDLRGFIVLRVAGVLACRNLGPRPGKLVRMRDFLGAVGTARGRMPPGQKPLAKFILNNAASAGGEVNDARTFTRGN